MRSPLLRIDPELEDLLKKIASENGVSVVDASRILARNTLKKKKSDGLGINWNII